MTEPVILPNQDPEPVVKTAKEALSEGLKVVQQATVEDQKGNIAEAVQLYSVALELFQQAIDGSTDTKLTELISTKCAMYIKRMEHLRFILLQDQFPEVPTEKSESESIEDLEKQFGKILTIYQVKTIVNFYFSQNEKLMFQYLTIVITIMKYLNQK